MASPADQRVLDLLEKWLKSLELHAAYTSLDAGGYATVQAWPEHQRPSRWIIDLATQKALGLRARVRERIKAGDAGFSDSLELMALLTNLLGSEHIERFIPLAESNGDESSAAQSVAIARPADAAPPAGSVPTPLDEPEIVLGNFPKPVVDQVIVDAARLVQWGRKWYEISELISSMADRPALTDVRRILKDNKTVIDKKAGRG